MNTTHAKTAIAAAAKGDAVIYELVGQEGAEYTGIIHGIDTTGRYAIIWHGEARPRLVAFAKIAAARTIARDLEVR